MTEYRRCRTDEEKRGSVLYEYVERYANNMSVLKLSGSSNKAEIAAYARHNYLKGGHGRVYYIIMLLGNDTYACLLLDKYDPTAPGHVELGILPSDYLTVADALGNGTSSNITV